MQDNSFEQNNRKKILELLHFLQLNSMADGLNKIDYKKFISHYISQDAVADIKEVNDVEFFQTYIANMVDLVIELCQTFNVNFRDEKASRFGAIFNESWSNIHAKLKNKATDQKEIKKNLLYKCVQLGLSALLEKIVDKVIYHSDSNRDIYDILVKNFEDLFKEGLRSNNFYCCYVLWKLSKISPQLNNIASNVIKNLNDDSYKQLIIKLQTFASPRNSVQALVNMLRNLDRKSTTSRQTPNNQATPSSQRNTTYYDDSVTTVSKQWTAIRQAIVYDAIEKFIELTSRDVSINDIVPASGNRSLLHYACEANAENIITYLFASGVDVMCLDDNGRSPLFGLFSHATSRQVHIIDTVKSMLTTTENFLAVLTQQDINGDTLLHLAARKDFLELYKLLSEMGADETVNNLNNESPRQLHQTEFFKIDQNNQALLKIAKELIEREALQEIEELDLEALINEKIADAGECTLLHFACETTKIKVIFSLILKGADLFIPDKIGRTPLHEMIEYLEQTDIIQLLLSVLDSPKEVKKLKQLLASTNGETQNILSLATQKSYMDLHVLLLQYASAPQTLTTPARSRQVADTDTISSISRDIWITKLQISHDQAAAEARKKAEQTESLSPSFNQS